MDHTKIRIITIKFLFVIFLVAIFGCYKIKPKEFKSLDISLSTANKKLSIDQTEEIKLSNFHSGYLKIITPPYVSKDEFMPIVNDVRLSEELAWITAAKESCHLFIIDNNRLIANMSLPGYIDVNGRVFFSKNTDIVLTVKKISKSNRPLVIEGLR